MKNHKNKGNSKQATNTRKAKAEATELQTVAVTPHRLPETDKKTESMRVAAHYVTNKFRNSENKQGSLFDSIQPELKDYLTDRDVDIKEVYGIKLLPEQDKMMNTLLSLLHQNSNTQIDKNNKPAEPDLFYRGNAPELTKIQQYGKEYIKAPVLVTTQAELCKEYTGKSDYSGAEILSMWKTLISIAEHFILLSYTYKEWVPEGKTYREVTHGVQTYKPLIELNKFYEDIKGSSRDNKRLFISDEGKIVINFHAVFVHQIDTNFISYPTDINKRIEIACGGANKVTTPVRALVDKLMFKLSKKQYTYTIDEHNLPHTLGLETEMRQGRKSRIKSKIESTIKAVINLGLVLQVELTKGKYQQPQYIFTLNKDFQ